MAKFKEWTAIISILMKFQLVLTGEMDQNTLLENNTYFLKLRLEKLYF